MRRSLTDRAIAALKPPPLGKRHLLYDRDVPGLAVMVTDRGTKSFVLYTRYPASRKPSRRFIGKVSDLPLAKAREKAKRWRGLIAEGKDPAEFEAAERRAAARRQANTFEVVAVAFIERSVRGQRTADDTEREIRKHLIARWGSHPITAITTDDVTELCREFREASIGSHGHNVFGHARRLFRWAIQQRVYGLERSPCENLSAAALIGKRMRRNRTLDTAEIAALWRACDVLGYPYGPLFRLLLLTGTRRAEASDSRWSEFDLARNLWVIPADRFKSDRVHIVPLSHDAIEVLEDLPRFVGDHLFSTSAGKKPVDGFSKAKLRLDGAMQALLGEVKLAPFVIHDIRRTVRSRLSELRVAPVVAEVVIGHTLPGLLGVYDQWDYLEEKRDALERWADRLRQIVDQGVSERDKAMTLRTTP